MVNERSIQTCELRVTIAVMPVSSSVCWNHVFCGRPVERFQSAAGEVPSKNDGWQLQSLWSCMLCSRASRPNIVDPIYYIWVDVIWTWAYTVKLNVRYVKSRPARPSVLECGHLRTRPSFQHCIHPIKFHNDMMTVNPLESRGDYIVYHIK